LRELKLAAKRVWLSSRSCLSFQDGRFSTRQAILLATFLSFVLSDRTLLVGDAFCTTKPESFFEAAVVQHAELHGPLSYFTSDWDAARNSVKLLAALEPTVLAPGHGKPLSGSNVPSALRQLSTDFDKIAVPANERPK
jgi:glyoxylase-like metal-dependent hydrolase (beta-lactamase superfamily II)